MIAQHSRSALLAGLLTAALFTPAWSADGDAAKPETAGAEQAVALAAAPHAGPVVARESLATEAAARGATVVVGENQPTRSSASPTAGKRYAGTRGSVAYYRPHRYGLILGIGY